MRTYLFLPLICFSFFAHAQKQESYELTSPNGKIAVQIAPGPKLSWSVSHDGKQIIAPSTISLQLETGGSLGDNASIISTRPEKVNTSFKAINYKKDVVQDQYNQLTLNCKG